MSETNLGDTEVRLPPPPETGIEFVDRMMAWVRNNYNDLARTCEANGLPKPPPWE